MASTTRRVLYTGVTSDLKGRVWEHRNKIYPKSFTAKYNCIVLVYFQYFDFISHAIEEEQRLKSGSRKPKEDLIVTINPEWRDLWDDIQDW